MSFVIFTNAALMIAMGGLMGIVGLLFPDTRWVFLSSGLVVALTGGFVVLAVSNRLRDFRTLHAFVLTGTIWITGAAAGAVPLWVWQLSPVDAFFESMSGITTTGSTVMTGLDGTAKGILLWRAILHGIGGIGFVVAGIAFLPILRVGGMQLFRTESSDRGDKEMASAAKLASATVWIYLGLIALCTAVYFGGGMTFFEAVCHALATLSTGGYSTSDSSFGYFQSPFLEWSATVFMLAGALPFAWYIRALNKGVFTSEQVRAFLIFLAVTIAVMTVWRVATSDSGVHDALRQSAFNIVSVVTTTGFATTDYTDLGALRGGGVLLPDGGGRLHGIDRGRGEDDAVDHLRPVPQDVRPVDPFAELGLGAAVRRETGDARRAVGRDDVLHLLRADGRGSRGPARPSGARPRHRDQRRADGGGERRARGGPDHRAGREFLDPAGQREGRPQLRDVRGPARDRDGLRPHDAPVLAGGELTRRVRSR